jgi:membrane-anchored protein YejM (alkaline phosphatase superfamily)
MSLNLKDLNPETIAKLGDHHDIIAKTLMDVVEENRKPTKAEQGSKMVKEQVRQHAIRVLATVEKLTQAERRRVLEHARRLNEV